MTVLVDSNVLLDIFTEDPKWYSWSSRQLTRSAESEILAINPIIYSEVSVRFRQIEELEDAIPEHYFKRLFIPYEAAFLAGKCFLKYKKQGGKRSVPLPDFFIGAHAAVSKLSLLTRDPSRYQHYFPSVKLIAP